MFDNERSRSGALGESEKKGFPFEALLIQSRICVSFVVVEVHVKE